MKNTFLIAFSLLLYSLSAQKNYVDGYIVKEGDTIKGKVRDKFLFSTTRTIRFINANGKKQRLTPKQITAYGKLNLVNYRSINTGLIGTSMRFAQILENGDLILFSYTTTSSSTGTTSHSPISGGYGGSPAYTSTTTRTGVTSTRLFLQRKNDPDAKRIPALGFVSFMSEYVNDDPQVRKLITDKNLRYGDINIIVQKYNQNKLKK